VDKIKSDIKKKEQELEKLKKERGAVRFDISVVDREIMVAEIQLKELHRQAMEKTLKVGSQ
jgi:septal ring factor EnvC (AmiA/AmiB activator)